MKIFNKDGIKLVISNCKIYLFQGRYLLLSLGKDGLIDKTQYFAQFFPEEYKEINDESIKLLMVDLYNKFSGVSNITLDIGNVTCRAKRIECLKKPYDTVRELELIDE